MSTIRPPLTTSMTGPRDGAAGVGDGLDTTPGSLVLSALLGEDEPTFVVFLVEHEGLDPLADATTTSPGSTALRIESSWSGDHAFGLVTDVDEHLVVVDGYDRALDDVAFVELENGVVECGLEIVRDVVGEVADAAWPRWPPARGRRGVRSSGRPRDSLRRCGGGSRGLGAGVRQLGRRASSSRPRRTRPLRRRQPRPPRRATVSGSRTQSPPRTQPLPQDSSFHGVRHFRGSSGSQRTQSASVSARALPMPRAFPLRFRHRARRPRSRVAGVVGRHGLVFFGHRVW